MVMAMMFFLNIFIYVPMFHIYIYIYIFFFFGCLAGDFPLNESTKIAIQSCPSPSEITLGEGLHGFSGLGAV